MTLQKLLELRGRWAPACFAVLALVLIPVALTVSEDPIVFAVFVFVMGHHVVRIGTAAPGG